MMRDLALRMGWKDEMIFFVRLHGKNSKSMTSDDKCGMVNDEKNSRLY